jgi:hypothetical protein
VRGQVTRRKTPDEYKYLSTSDDIYGVEDLSNALSLNLTQTYCLRVHKDLLKEGGSGDKAVVNAHSKGIPCRSLIQSRGVGDHLTLGLLYASF